MYIKGRIHLRHVYFGLARNSQRIGNFRAIVIQACSRSFGIKHRPVSRSSPKRATHDFEVYRKSPLLEIRVHLPKIDEPRKLIENNKISEIESDAGKQNSRDLDGRSKHRDSRRSWQQRSP
jgi:hypothetical protein